MSLADQIDGWLGRPRVTREEPDNWERAKAEREREYRQREAEREAERQRTDGERIQLAVERTRQRVDDATAEALARAEERLPWLDRLPADSRRFLEKGRKAQLSDPAGVRDRIRRTHGEQWLAQEIEAAYRSHPDYRRETATITRAPDGTTIPAQPATLAEAAVRAELVRVGGDLDRLDYARIAEAMRRSISDHRPPTTARGV